MTDCARGEYDAKKNGFHGNWTGHNARKETVDETRQHQNNDKYENQANGNVKQAMLARQTDHSLVANTDPHETAKDQTASPRAPAQAPARGIRQGARQDNRLKRLAETPCRLGIDRLIIILTPQPSCVVQCILSLNCATHLSNHLPLSGINIPPTLSRSKKTHKTMQQVCIRSFIPK